jgi:hypothetical protein
MELCKLVEGEGSLKAKMLQGRWKKRRLRRGLAMLRVQITSGSPDVTVQGAAADV